jgi:Flp pilus assembly protein TadG
LKRGKTARKALRTAAIPVKSDEGQALVEFALVAVVFLTLVFGIIDFARLFESWITVQHAARTGARYAVTGRSDCDEYTDNRVGCIVYVARRASTGLTGTTADVNVSVRSWSYPAYADPPVEGSPGDACDAIEVQVDYDHHIMTPLVAQVVSHVPLRGRQRVLNEPFGPCGGS